MTTFYYVEVNDTVIVLLARLRRLKEESIVLCTGDWWYGPQNCISVGLGLYPGAVCLKSEIHEIHEIQSLARNPLPNQRNPLPKKRNPRHPPVDFAD